jgi:hypothetical protein
MSENQLTGALRVRDTRTFVVCRSIEIRRHAYRERGDYVNVVLADMSPPISGLVHRHGQLEETTCPELNFVRRVP